MMETMIPSQLGMRLRTKKEEEKKEAIKKEKKAQIKKMGEKERRDNVTILLPHLCFKVDHDLHNGESPMLSLSYTSGNFSL